MFMSGAAADSRLQKLASPTFQVPPSSTDFPDWLLASVWPAASMLYLTAASVEEVTVEETPCASGLLEKLLIAPANLLPFCSSLTRSLTGVEAAKNFCQLALISAVAPVDVPVPLPPELADAPALVADAPVVVETGIWVPVDEELLELLEQAAAASTITIAPATARLLAGWNRIAPPPEGLGWKWLLAMVANPRAYRILFPVGRFLLNAGPRLPTLTSGAGFLSLPLLYLKHVSRMGLKGRG